MARIVKQITCDKCGKEFIFDGDNYTHIEGHVQDGCRGVEIDHYFCHECTHKFLDFVNLR